VAEIVLNATVLVLNRSYLPIHVTSARRAFALVYRDVARVVNEEYETFDFESWRRRRGAKVTRANLGFLSRRRYDIRL